MQKPMFTMLTVLVCASLTQSCSKSQNQDTVSVEQAPVTSTTEQAPSKDFIEIDEYRFKLSPDISDSGEAHLDFYVHDKDDKHVKGVTGIFHITKPDGSKEDLIIEEEEPHDHYHGKTVLKDPGEYGVVAQIQIADKKLNPRFNFKQDKKFE